MSTNSYIGIENQDGTVDYIYCHFDGYVAGVGTALLLAYRTPEAARALVDSGDQSSLGDPYSAHPDEVWNDIRPRNIHNVGLFAKISTYTYLFSADTNSWVLVRGGSTPVKVGIQRALEKNL
jgi:hypothetical protein